MPFDVGSGKESAFVLFGACVPVKGARRSVVCDLHRSRLRPIPNTLYDILTRGARASIEQIKAEYPQGAQANIEEYLNVLCAEGYGFWTDEPERFPELPRTADSPARCSNAIIDVAADSAHDFRAIFGQLDELLCMAIQVRAYDDLAPEEIERIVACAEEYRFRHLDFILKASERVDLAFLRRLCDEHRLVSRAVLHSASSDSRETLGQMGVEIVMTRARFDADQCGQVGLSLFCVNTHHFMEAQCSNSCLNKKLSVASNGDIKACPSMPQSYGNIRVDKLAPVLERPEVRALWAITKDQVQVCKDCEFRYVCTDCRAHTLDGSLYSKPSACTYNPYLARWE